MHLLLRPVDQDDVGVLLRPVEHNVFSVRRDVEAAQAALVRQLCELSLLAGDEIEPPDVQRLRVFPKDEMRFVQEAIAVGADPKIPLIVPHSIVYLDVKGDRRKT